MNIKFKIANFYSCVAFECKRFSNDRKYNDKKICVPRHCDTDYNCPYPYRCQKDKCVEDKTDDKCTNDEGNQYHFIDLRLIVQVFSSQKFTNDYKSFLLFS